MPQSTSSAEPKELATYAGRAVALDSHLAAASHPLRGALQHFEATCREPSFRLSVSYVADWMAGHARAAEVVERWVETVGAGFAWADTGAVLYERLHLPSWCRFTAQVFLFGYLSWRGGQWTSGFGPAFFFRLPPQYLYWIGKKVVLLHELMTTVVQTSSFVASVISIALRLRYPSPKSTQDSLDAAVPGNMAELYSAIEKQDSNEPISVRQIGPQEYLVLVKGTQQDAFWGRSNTWFSNAYTGLGVDSIYSERVRRIIESQIPVGATVHLAGHSQGGHVVMIVGNHLAADGLYVVGSMTAFGAYRNQFIDPKVGEAKTYLFDNDILNFVDKTDEVLVPRKALIEQWNSETILHDSGTWNPIDAHTSYENSLELQNTPVPFHAAPNFGIVQRDYDAPEEPPVTKAVTKTVSWANIQIVTAQRYTVAGINVATTTAENAANTAKSKVTWGLETAADTAEATRDEIHEAARKIVESVRRRDTSETPL